MLVRLIAINTFVAELTTHLRLEECQRRVNRDIYVAMLGVPLIRIKPGLQLMQEGSLALGLKPLAVLDKRVTNSPTLRFAVAPFDTWDGVQTTLSDLAFGSSLTKNSHCLGLQRVLGDRPKMAVNYGPIPLHQLPFPGNAELIGCTSGPVADRLAWRLSLGAPTLKAALSHWLIPRHAAHLQEAVERGRIVLWLQLFGDDDERRAYRSLLARSSNAVGVHDLIGE